MSRSVAPSRLRGIALDIGGRYGVSSSAVLSRERGKRVAEARMAVMCELWSLGFNKSAIARAMNRDHTTVGHAIRKERG